MTVNLRKVLLSFTAMSGLTLSLATPMAISQETTTTVPVEDEAEARQDKITITGSRIKRATNAESAVPLQVFSAENFAEIGTTDLAEAITQIPGVGDGVSVQNSNNLIQTSGLSTISLRRLGDDRTLVLINGKRAVSNSGNSDRVSLSTLPVGFVAQSEITTGGASAVYGSDAIAGVANFILEDSFEGLEFDARFSAPEASGGEEMRLSALGGKKFSQDRGYFLVGLSYRDEDAILADETRPESILAVEFDDPIPSTGSDGWTNEINQPGCGGVDTDRHCLVPSLSSYTPGGNFEGDAWFRDGQWFNDQSLRPSDRPAGSDFYGDFDGFNFRPGRTLRGSREIFNAGLHSTYDFTPNMKGSATALFSTVESATFGGFELLDNGDTGSIASDHPFIPPEVEETRSGSVSYRRRLVELGEQGRINDRDTIRVMADLSGSFDNGYEWEVFATHGYFEQNQYNPNEVNYQNAAFALDIEADGAGGFQCADAGARAAGCVPLNLFGEGTISSQAAEYIRYNGYGTQTREQTTFGGYLSGDAFELPAGPVQFAVGTEFRREEQETNGDPDGDLVGGIDGDPTTDDVDVTSLATFPSVMASYEVLEGYAEVDIPLIRDQLNLQLAARVGDYNTIGQIFSYNVGAVWFPVEDLRLRAQYSKSQRAPNLTEIFSPPRPDADNLADPCDGLLPDGSGIDAPEGDGGAAADLAIVSANCLSEVGIQAFFADPDNAGLPFEFDGSTQGPNSGNPNVQEETADTITAGFAYAPSFAPGLTFIADYYLIEIDDAITSISTQNTVDLCYSSSDFPNNRFCDVITRNPVTGGVVEVINFQENLLQEVVEGIDVSLSYDEFAFVAIPGEFDFDFRYSHYLTEEVTFVGIGGTELTTSPLGEIESPEDEFRAQLGYNYENFRLSYTVTFDSGGVDDLLNDPNPTDDRYFAVDDQDYHRIYARYDFGSDDQFRIYGGVNNIFDDLGPLVPTGTDYGSSLNLVTDLNDAVGREFYIGVRARF